MSQPLKNINIVTLAVNVPGPLAAKRWLNLGATVTKVEPPDGDPLERYCPDWYQEVNAGQHIQRLNLKTKEGKKALSQLFLSADLLLTAQRTKALDNLGLDWASLQQNYPQINHIAIVGYPTPNDNEAGHDLTYQAKLGLLKDGNMPSTLISDMAGAEMAALEGLALLMESKATKKGQKKVIALSESAKYMAQPLKYKLTNEGGLLAGTLPEYAIYETKKGSVALAALEPHFSARLKEQLELETLNAESLSQVFKQNTASEWVTWAKERDIPLAEIK
jgi:crotonobetainyl-CoA:carnitine CoA-transferase CaiB-like acyl-CoA transferase